MSFPLLVGYEIVEQCDITSAASFGDVCNVNMNLFLIFILGLFNRNSGEKYGTLSLKRILESFRLLDG